MEQISQALNAIRSAKTMCRMCRRLVNFGYVALWETAGKLICCRVR